MKSSEKKIIINWLYCGLLLVALMIVIGGITRLTHSGLSMVEWNLISGAIPPLNDLEWKESFKKYQQFPEFKKINSSMVLSEFKVIFFWEYIHRLLGRLIGLFFIIPLIIFWVKKWINQKQKKQLIILLSLGSLQAFLGWYMVKSGLVDIPAVSHFRLAIHLFTAFVLMCYIYWLILDFSNTVKKTSKSINRFSKYLIVALFIQIIYGAFVAGLKAGYSLNGNWVIQNIFGYSLNKENTFDLLNSSNDIQAFHRFFAWIIFGITIAFFNKTRKTHLNKEGLVVIGLTLLQIVLGISTLLLRVQIHLAVIHQLTAIILLLSVIKITYLSNEKTQLDT